MSAKLYDCAMFHAYCRECAVRLARSEVAEQMHGTVVA